MTRKNSLFKQLPVASPHCLFPKISCRSPAEALCYVSCATGKPEKKQLLHLSLAVTLGVALFSVCKCKSDDDLTITKFTRHDLFLNTDENRTKCVYYEMHYNRNNSLIKAKIINRTFSEFEFTDCIFNHFWIKRDSKNASAIVPKSEIKLTQVYSYGNASLYIVPKPILHNFMNTMSSVFYHHKFQIKNIEPVLTLHPKLKVLLTWMALNFALGKGELTLEKTVAAAVFDPAMQGLIFIPSNKTKCEKLTHVGLPFKFYLYRRVFKSIQGVLDPTAAYCTLALYVKRKIKLPQGYLSD
ncbi:hypothetical protein RUM43_008269 [Polyplax serrata]|uniref:Uncharacterized protein n=1 Tax=Polyplax serrata TaxID=468196 RepID=A0AAN8S8B6_POLSC